MTTVKAYYYDGISARRHAVTLSLDQGSLAIHGAEVTRTEIFSTVRVSEKLGNSPRLLYFADGSNCEVRDHDAFEVLLNAAGYRRHSWISSLEKDWRYALVALLLSVSCGIAGYRWGLPWAAAPVAARIPPNTAHIIDVQALKVFDENLMQPSQLSAARRKILQQRFNDLRKGQDLPPYPLEFRHSKTIGANAFALPGGTVVVTDELVALADNDEEILAVLAHELGHVSEHHPLRQLLQGSVVGFVMTWYLGDISSLLAAAPALLLQTSYSRDFERRADNYAANLLRANRISAGRLADMLEKLESNYRGENKDRNQRISVPEILSSHPDTTERVRALRAL